MGLSETLPGVTSRAGSGVKPEREGLRETLQLASVFALVTFVLHVAINLRAQHIGYGLFRDEMYYIVCGRHLAWGYVDQPPIVALAARFSELVFGWHSLALFRLLPSLAGALEVAGHTSESFVHSECSQYLRSSVLGPSNWSDELWRWDCYDRNSFTDPGI
jgi:hypothetical protein